MIRKRLLVTGLAMSMCLNQMPPTVLVRASQNTNSNSKFEVEVNNSKAGENVLNKFIEKLEDVATVEKKPKLEGRNMFTILAKKV